MKKLNYFIVLVFLFNFFDVYAQYPRSGCWYPQQVLNWTPDFDPDVRFNKATIPYKPRVSKNILKANEFQYYEGKIYGLLTMNPNASTCPSQDASNFIGYNPTSWQYLDVLVWWGGSSSEGIILPPSAPVIDAAHLNGVKILGTIFGPPSAYGGKRTWIDEMLTVKDGKYPFAYQLYKLTKYYGFDGWFLNEEISRLPTADIQKWKQFLTEYMTYAIADGNGHHEFQLYDAGTNPTKLVELLKIPGVSYFVNYGGTSSIASHKTTMLNAGFTESQIFEKLYYGIEITQGGLTGNAAQFKTVFPNVGHAASMATFGSVQLLWKDVVSSLLNTENDCGELAYAAIKKSYENEAIHYINKENDPSNTSNRNATIWPGFANAIVERTAIQSKPFITTFSSGQGKARYVNGQKLGQHDWSHRGSQTLMPTWRWWISAPSGHNLKVNYHWDDAFNFGSSLKVTGSLNGGSDYIVRMFKSDLPIEAGDKFNLTYKTNTSNSIELKLSFLDDINSWVTLPLTENKNVNGWTVAGVDLSAYTGKTIGVIALNFRAPQTVLNYEALLGQMSIFSSEYSTQVTQVSNLATKSTLDQDGGDIRLYWDVSTYPEVHHYNIYMEVNGNKELVGNTRNGGFYISKLNRTSPNEKSIKLFVTVVNNDMTEGPGVALEMIYPQLSFSTGSIRVSKSLLRVGEEVEFECRANNFPDSYSWNVPNATLISQSGNKAVFKFNSEGMQNVTVNVTNSIGTNPIVVNGAVNVSNLSTTNLVSVGAAIHSYSGSTSTGLPQYLVDGVQVPGSIEYKWCNISNHWVIIDLKEAYDIYSFKIWDTGHLESATGNIDAYQIYLSNDVNANDWILAIDEKGRKVENTKTDYCIPTKARYIKFVPLQEATIRIWEFEVFALSGESISMGFTNNITLDVNETTHVSLPYSLGSSAKQSNFEFTAASSHPDVVLVDNVSVDESSHQLNVSLRALIPFDESEIKLNLKNGTEILERNFIAKTSKKDYGNIASDLPVLAGRYISGNWQYTSETSLTDGNNTTGWVSGNTSSAINRRIVLDMGKDYKVGHISIYAKSGNYTPTVKAIRAYIGTENIDASYQTLGSLSNVNLLTVSNLKIVPAEEKSGRYVMIQFEMNTYSALDVYELDVLAYTPPTSLSENISVTFDVYPNIIKKGGFVPLKVTSKNAKVYVYNLMGKILFKDQVEDGIWVLNTNNLSQGTYIVRLYENTSEFKISKVVIY